MSFQRGSRDPEAALTMLTSISWNSCVGTGIYCNLDADLICKKVTVPSGLTYHSFARWPDPVHPLFVAGPVRSSKPKRMRSCQRRRRKRKAIVTPWLFICILVMQSQHFSLSERRNKQSKCFLAHIYELLKQEQYCSRTMSVAFCIFSDSASWMFYDTVTFTITSGHDTPRASH